MRLVFMGTPQFAVPILECLLHSEYEIAAVYTAPDARAGRGRNLSFPPVKEAALAHLLRVEQPESLKTAEEVEKLANLHPDLIVVAAYGQILRQNILDIPRYGCLNAHPSLLPRHRGPAPVAFAIMANDAVTGTTIMLMDKGIDTGPILMQKKEAIRPEDTTISLESRLAKMSAQLLLEAIPLQIKRCITPQIQDNEKATYSRLITKEDGNIDWHMTAEEIARRVRAFQPWPNCYTYWQGKLLKILQATPVGIQSGTPGRIVSLKTDNGFAVGVETSAGMLGIQKLQLEGKNAISAREFLQGHGDFIGSILSIR